MQFYNHKPRVTAQNSFSTASNLKSACILTQAKHHISLYTAAQCVSYSTWDFSWHWSKHSSDRPHKLTTVCCSKSYNRSHKEPKEGEVKVSGETSLVWKMKVPSPTNRRKTMQMTGIWWLTELSVKVCSMYGRCVLCLLSALLHTPGVCKRVHPLDLGGACASLCAVQRGTAERGRRERAEEPKILTATEFKSSLYLPLSLSLSSSAAGSSLAHSLSRSLCCEFLLIPSLFTSLSVYVSSSPLWVSATPTA